MNTKSTDSTNSTSSLHDPNNDTLVTIRTFCSRYSWPSESAMRAYVFRAEELNLSEAFVRVNRRILVDVSKFFLLIKQVKNHPANGVHHATTHLRNERRPNLSAI